MRSYISLSFLCFLLSFGPSSAGAAPNISEEKEEYIHQKMRLFETVATRIDTYVDKGVPAIRFSVKNLGDKTLSRVEITVYFLDAYEQRFYEEEYIPVLVSEYSFGGGNKPLKPNYTFRMDEGKYFTIKNLGDEWSGNAEFEITGIEFAE